MIIRESTLFKQFKCLGGACPHTCCHGWLIPLSAEDAGRLSTMRGIYGLHFGISSLIFGNENLNHSTLTCPYLNRKGLCSLQKKFGHDFIPEACRDYPRFYRNYGFCEERMLDLSCIEAAGSFVRSFRDLDFIEYEGKAESEKCTTNDDPEFWEEVFAERSDIVAALKNVKTYEELSALTGALTVRCREAQDAFVGGDTGYFARVPLNVFLTGKASRPEMFPFDCKLLEKLLSTSVYGKLLRRTNPALFRLFELYFGSRRKGKVNAGSWQETARDFMERYSGSSQLFSALLAYYMLQYYLKIYEDYSFLKNTVLGIIHLNIIFLFCVLSEKEKRRSGTPFTEEDVAEITAVYNRRAYFNDDIKDELYAAVSGAVQFPASSSILSSRCS